MAKILTIQHIHCETLGIISDCFAASGCIPEYIRTFDGQSIPREMGELPGLIITGGPMGVYDQERFPFLLDEMRLIECALKENKPILGVCLGSQLIAATLRAEVKQAKTKEIGWHAVFLEESALKDPLWKRVTSPFIACHWHGDVFELPPDSVSLARSERTACQGFRFGQNVYGLLFHMEMTDRIIREMLDVFKDEILEAGVDKNLIEMGIRVHLPKLQSIGMQVFNRWAKRIDCQ